MVDDEQRAAANQVHDLHQVGHRKKLAVRKPPPITSTIIKIQTTAIFASLEKRVSDTLHKRAISVSVTRFPAKNKRGQYWHFAAVAYGGLRPVLLSKSAKYGGKLRLLENLQSSA
jgi:hypothetical protein